MFRPRIGRHDEPGGDAGGGRGRAPVGSARRCLPRGAGRGRGGGGRPAARAGARRACRLPYTAGARARRRAGAKRGLLLRHKVYIYLASASVRVEPDGPPQGAGQKEASKSANFNVS